ncbi:MAG: hypothetical protein L0229_25190 [Blastocatellia bacterium]|nr:hypothetical protein [Blastocatellia bacterium]
MKPIKLTTLILVSAFVFAVIGCATDDAPPAQPAGEAGQGDKSAQPVPPTGEIKLEDGSTIALSELPDGTKTEARTFETGEVARVTRTTSPDGKRSAKVEFRDEREVEMEDESFVEQAMDATGDAIAVAANKTWNASKTAGREVGDKSEDVAGAVVDTSKTVAGKTADAGKATGKAVGKGAKTTGKAVGKGAKAVGKGAKKLGEKIKP